MENNKNSEIAINMPIAIINKLSKDSIINNINKSITKNKKEIKILAVTILLLLASLMVCIQDTSDELKTIIAPFLIVLIMIIIVLIAINILQNTEYKKVLNADNFDAKLKESLKTIKELKEISNNEASLYNTFIMFNELQEILDYKIYINNNELIIKYLTKDEESRTKRFKISNTIKYKHNIINSFNSNKNNNILTTTEITDDIKELVLVYLTENGIKIELPISVLYNDITECKFK